MDAIQIILEAESDRDGKSRPDANPATGPKRLGSEFQPPAGTPHLQPMKPKAAVSSGLIWALGSLRRKAPIPSIHTHLASPGRVLRTPYPAASTCGLTASSCCWPGGGHGGQAARQATLRGGLYPIAGISGPWWPCVVPPPKIDQADPPPLSVPGRVIYAVRHQS